MSDVNLGSCPEYGGADFQVGGSGSGSEGGNGGIGGIGGGNQAAVSEGGLERGGVRVSCSGEGGQGYCRSDSDCKGCVCRVVELANSILQFGMGSLLVGGCSS